MILKYVRKSEVSPKKSEKNVKDSKKNMFKNEKIKEI